MQVHSPGGDDQTIGMDEIDQPDDERHAGAYQQAKEQFLSSCVTRIIFDNGAL